MTGNNPFSLEGRTILVTGASSGIGRRTAIDCSRMGARVIITGRNKERLDEVMGQMEGTGNLAVVADLTQQDQLEHLLEQLPVVDGVVLCAGQGTVVPFKMADRKKIDPIFEINYFAPVELLRMLLKKKKLANGASVVFVSSIGGIDSITIGNSIYGASKAAFNSAMRFCALELSPKKIRVNSVCPGMVNTKLIKGGAVSEEQHQADMQKYPLKRYGEPEDIANGIIYLLSDAASWVTGHSLVIDGGYTL
ncbi:MAG: SDR family oxidoreductase [Muribaculaceae bacterium]|nr:SDR family oxidoreductase [Muribaculaceae bacterium]